MVVTYLTKHPTVVYFVTNLLLSKYYVMKNFQHKLDKPKDRLLSMPEIILIRLFNLVSLL